MTPTTPPPEPEEMTMDEKIRQAAKAAAPVFVAMGWTWAPDKRVPTEAQIAATFREIYGHLKREHMEYVSTGRLRVQWDKTFGAEFFVEVS